MRTHIIILAILSLALTSCSKWDGDSNVIRLRVKSIETKGSAITTESINKSGQKFAVNAYADEEYGTTGDIHPAGLYFDKLVATCGAGKKWDFDEPQYWLNGVNIRFVSYAPIDDELNGTRTIEALPSNSNVISFTYAQPASNGSSDASSQQDIIFAFNSETREFSGDNISGGTGTSTTTPYVDVTFHHALSQILFVISPDDDTFDASGLEIVSITLRNVSGSGSATFEDNEFTWSQLGTKTSVYTQTVNAGFMGTSGFACPTGWSTSSYKDSHSVSHVLYVYNNAFFMIPQTGAELGVTFKRLADGTTVDKSVSLTDKWDPGYYYRYKLNAKTLNDNIVFDVTVTAWEVGGSASL